MLGRKFRRQESIGPYIVDFYSPVYKVIRFENKLVHIDLEFVLQRIREEVWERRKKI